MAGKLITVFGATGNQGNSIARALLAKGYKVRAVTRNPDNPKAQELKAKGAEVFQVKNMDDNAALENAIEGAYGVFCVTNYWAMLAENPSTAKDRELSQGKAVGDICKKLGVKHLVYSGVEHAKKIFGKDCPHFDGKGMVEEYLDEIGVPNTSTRYSFYFNNFFTFFPPQKNDDGTYSITLPMEGPMDGVCVEDAGPVVAAIFDNPSEFIGKKIGLSNDKLTLQEYTAIISKVTGKTLKYNQVPVEVFQKFPFPGAGALAVMFDFYARGNPDRDVALTRRLNPAALTFEQWVEKNKEKFSWP